MLILLGLKLLPWFLGAKGSSGPPGPRGIRGEKGNFYYFKRYVYSIATLLHTSAHWHFLGGRTEVNANSWWKDGRRKNFFVLLCFIILKHYNYRLSSAEYD